MRLEHWLYTIPLRLRSVFRRRQVDQELDEEISEYAVSISLLSAAAFVAVPGLSFTWRMDLPVPCNK